MSFTEDDLRDLLAERTAVAPRRDTDVAQIVRRGRRVLLARWTVGVALTGAAAAAMLTFMPGEPPATMAAKPRPTLSTTSSMRALTPMDLQPPATLDGLKRTGGMSATGMGWGQDLPATPATRLVSVYCQDTGAWVVISLRGTKEGKAARCGADGVRFEVKRQVKKIRVWVFPAGAPVDDRPIAECVVHDKKLGTCDGRYAATELVRYDVAFAMAGDTGSQLAGNWAVGVYSGG
ncbi:hypothetical protein OIE66_37520 [Nonomuraea sp. NBC_01738]|uniref:hypothetical protein n=1 Tax=Nonomuraea sp. NBC_01738 TaxID=2976003 RepID=UPI002E13EEAA|nr:hypothetical protein OIE66_37520 [Nonomuraea sp. NBC_01738]